MQNSELAEKSQVFLYITAAIYLSKLDNNVFCSRYKHTLGFTSLPK